MQDMWNKTNFSLFCCINNIGLQQQAAAHSVVQSEGHKQLQQCRFLFHQALDADEAGNKDEAVDLYTQAVELGIRTVSVLRTIIAFDACYHGVCPFLQIFLQV
jgi:MIT (microtubule interacting and transport) domain.